MNSLKKDFFSLHTKNGLKKNQSGQTLIEFMLSVIFILTPVFIFVFSTAYLIYSNEIASLKLYKGILCTETYNESPENCREQTLSELSKLLFFHKNLKLDLTNSSTKKTLTLHSRYQPFKSNFIFKKGLGLNTTYKKEILIDSL